MAASDSPADLAPSARELVARLGDDPTAPVKVVVSGGIGTGKTAVLTAVRTALRSAAVPALTRPPRPGEADGAVVVDDAHLLDDAELDALADRVDDPAATVVVATEPVVHRPALRALTLTLQREHPAVDLGPLAPGDVARLLSDAGGTPSTDLVRSLMVATAGLPFLVRPAITAVTEPDGSSAGIPQAAQFALIERLRLLDEQLLDTLLVLSLNRGLGADDVAAALRLPPDRARALVDRSHATGLIEPSHSRAFRRTLHRSLAEILGAARHHDTEISLLLSQIEMSTLSPDLALQLAEHGLRDDRLAAALTELASRSGGQPARAARLYRAAVDAGAAALSPQLADALAMTGDCVTAGRLADELLGSPDPAERAAAVRIAASIAAHDGSAAQAADLFRWLGPHPDAFVGAAGTVACLAAGDLAAARASVSAESGGPPTSTARAARSLAEGLLMSLDSPYPATVARLSQAVATDVPATAVAPDTPAALVTLAALHGGDPVRARSVIGRVAGGGSDGQALFVTRRHRLLLGWVRMQDGQLTAAGTDVAAAGADSETSPLHRRDALWASALQTAIARRSGDTGAMQKHWYAAMEVLAEYSVDLFSLLPLGELWVAAARLHQLERLQHTIDDAFALLASLGDPVLWSVPLHWSGVHAGILANAPDAVAPHGQALTAAAPHSAFARALATAGRTWLRVLANSVDVDEVTAAARLLAQFGLTWDATRLAGQAALQTPDGRVSGAMLQLARDLKQTVAEQDAAPIPRPVDDDPSRPSYMRLSKKEIEVAELLIRGMPYKLIGEQLSISPKTVEHHVARIRRRLGAESRTELLSMLRAMLTPA
ncbi:LuxR family transcriptional regulator [Mycolicibacterium flavescens]|uniref:Helix-turn-helix transcriptional regulator n=1 Tax=Mycolicibacterium flavescens TaxID=1776 RepID=A0A1E3RQ51_MYCFV|nr:isoniazid response ATPase/transcriptional regulator IniR [Mycolicibacterium flavescens]MCV7278285.1 LuxR family transcriptional regulator [Mycolicibacterium flavescens]ODQ91537.1 helix-turn-helix transcriptional regulator [Mycolicibacterium flavescens]